MDNTAAVSFLAQPVTRLLTLTGFCAFAETQALSRLAEAEISRLPMLFRREHGAPL